MVPNTPAANNEGFFETRKTISLPGIYEHVKNSRFSIPFHI
jgi:hypothetical protein